MTKRYAALATLAWLGPGLLMTALTGPAQGQPVPGMRTLDAQQASQCQPLGAVRGATDWQGREDAGVLAPARAEAQQGAARLGANAILWAHMSSSYNSDGRGHADVDGQAYRCFLAAPPKP